MRQAPGEILSGAYVTAAPADLDDTKGVDIDTTQGQAKVMKWAVKLVTTALVDWDLWVMDKAKKWWVATSYVQGYAKVNGRATFVVHDIGIYQRAAVVITANGTSAELQEFIENNFLRGD